MDADITIVGAGPAALSFARSLQHSPLQLTLLEQAAEKFVCKPDFDGRDIALTHASRTLLKELGVWQRIGDHNIHSIRKARVVDGHSNYAIDFNRDGKRYAALGYIVSNHDIRRALYQQVRTQDNVTIEFGRKVSRITKIKAGYRVDVEDGGSYTTPLLIAADSRFSSIRQQAGISADINDFARCAIVCRMKHEKTNDGTAHECFHYGHTLAVLPLGEKESSVVITISADKVSSLLEADESEFNDFVCEKFVYKLGLMELSSKRFSYPLIGVHADRFYRDHVALIGDAAVGMHPVTAHGFNLGLSSAHLLAEQILEAAQENRSYFSQQVLRRYQSRHMPNTRLMYHGTNGIVRLFTDDRIPGKMIRKIVIRVGNRLPPIRSVIEKKLTEANGRHFL